MEHVQTDSNALLAYVTSPPTHQRTYMCTSDSHQSPQNGLPQTIPHRRHGNVERMLGSRARTQEPHRGRQPHPRTDQNEGMARP